MQALQRDNMQIEWSDCIDLLTETHSYLFDSGQMGTLLQPHRASVRRMPCQYLALPTGLGANRVATLLCTCRATCWQDCERDYLFAVLKAFTNVLHGLSSV